MVKCLCSVGDFVHVRVKLMASLGTTDEVDRGWGVCYGKTTIPAVSVMTLSPMSRGVCSGEAGK
jgi:hypothetical protein